MPMRLERQLDDGTMELWKGEVRGKSLRITWGIVNGNEDHETRTFGSNADAQAAFDRAIAAKHEAGFREAVLGAQILPVALPVHPALEEAIREAKDDPGPYSVYAD